jgi:type III secretion protein J
MMLLLAAGCGKAELYHHLDEKEANEFIVTLAGAGITAEKAVEPAERGEPTYKIEVPKENLELAFHVLETYGLPRDKGHGIAQVYPGGGLIPGQFEEKAKYLLALTGEIETTLRSINRVVDARVHVVIPAESILKDEDEGTVRPTASVLIKYIQSPDGKKPIEDMDVKQLVSRAIEGLSINDVTVVPIAVAPPAPGHSAEGGGAAPGAEMTVDQCIEKYNLVDKVELRKVGPIAVHKDSYKYFLGVLGALAGVTLVFFVLWLVAFLQASSLRKKLAAQKSKTKKPTTTP